MVKTRQWILAEKPTDLPQLDGANPTFKVKETELPDLKDDEVLVKATYLSNDPAQRGWINKFINPERLYVPPVQDGEVMRARGLCDVVESKSSKYKAGDTVLANIGWAEYGIFPAKECQPAPDLPGGYNKTHYMGALGLTGLTAYFGLTEVVGTKASDTVVVSGAAGATGMMCVQIAKKIIGCKKVIGMAGTDEKCKWVEGLGADQCLNYKKDSFQEDLKKALPSPDGFADVYFDNVGGEILDVMLTRMARFGRISCCGAVSNYNSDMSKTSGLKNWFEMISMRINAKGFIVLDYMDKFPQAIEVMNKALADGKLEIEGGEQLVKTKFEDIPKTWMMLFSGQNTGKLITDLTSSAASSKL